MPPQPQQGPSFIESFRFVQWAVRFPALTLMVITRRDIGYRMLNPLVLIAVFGGLSVVAILATPGNEAARPMDILIFTFLGFMSGIAQRIRRWWDLNRGVKQHSYYIGSSPFDWRWLPNVVRRNCRVARFIDPIFWAAVGLALFPYSRALAIYLVFAAFCLRAYEYQVFERERDRDLDMVDSLIVAEDQARTLDQYEQAQNPPAYQSDAGIPTGIGDDIQKKVKLPKKKPQSYENN
jgi:hypothetical protein